MHCDVRSFHLRITWGMGWGGCREQIRCKGAKTFGQYQYTSARHCHVDWGKREDSLGKNVVRYNNRRVLLCVHYLSYYSKVEQHKTSPYYYRYTYLMMRGGRPKTYVRALLAETPKKKKLVMFESSFARCLGGGASSFSFAI